MSFDGMHTDHAALDASIAMLSADASLLSLEPIVDPIYVGDLARSENEWTKLELKLLLAWIKCPAPIADELLLRGVDAGL